MGVDIQDTQLNMSLMIMDVWRDDVSTKFFDMIVLQDEIVDNFMLCCFSQGVKDSCYFISFSCSTTFALFLLPHVPLN